MNFDLKIKVKSWQKKEVLAKNVLEKTEKLKQGKERLKQSESDL